VDSQIVQLRRRDEPLFAIDPDQYFRIVKAGFSEKRKKLRSSLSGGLNIAKTEADAWLQRAHISSNARAQELTLKDWYNLAICSKI
jgi:16S rRNA (adenine1518-N6/adenine1519-N6)-dimethyltransferase